MMGFPSFEDCALAAGVPVCEPDFECDPHARIGNAMHVANIGCIILATLTSVTFKDISWTVYHMHSAA